VDEYDTIEGEVEYFLPSALDLTVDAIGDKVGQYGGLVIPAHVDRPAFSMTSQLGAVVPGPWAAVECVRIPPRADSRMPDAGDFPGSCLDTLGYPLTTSSDAHYPEHVARRPFELDIFLEELAPRGPEGEADMEALKRALGRRPKFPKTTAIPPEAFITGT
jgi:PHP family Zn ribbon phosphoesterase